MPSWLEAAKMGYATFKAVRGVKRGYDIAPLQSEVLDYQRELRVVQQELGESQARVREMERELASERERDPAAGLTMDRGVWWAGPSREHGSQGPFCPACIVDRKTAIMQTMPNGSAFCTYCRKTQIDGVWPELAESYAEASRRASAQAEARRGGSWLGRVR